MAAVTVSPGVTKQITRSGSGPTPTKGATITVHCTGSVLASQIKKKFWSTRDQGQKEFTFQVGLGQVIAGWDEGCMSMQTGEQASLTIVSEKGYGKSGFPAWGIPPGATLVFDMEIISIAT